MVLAGVGRIIVFGVEPRVLIVFGRPWALITRSVNGYTRLAASQSFDVWGPAVARRWAIVVPGAVMTGIGRWSDLWLVRTVNF